MNGKLATPARDEQRLDKWLWHARFVKSRNLAAKYIVEGTVRVNRVRAHKASTPIRCGDVLTLSLHMKVRVVEIIGLSDRRGSPLEATALYRDLLSSQTALNADSGSNEHSGANPLIDGTPGS